MDREALGWISAREAVNRISPTFGGDAQAKAILADRLRDGVLTAKAASLSATIDAGKVCWRVAKPQARRLKRVNVLPMGSAPDKLNCLIDPALWSRSADWDADQKLWEWGKSNFLVTLARKAPGPWHRIQFISVHLSAAEIARMLEGSPVSPQSKAVKAADPQLPPMVKWDDWEDALIDLMMIADADGLEEHFGKLTVKGGPAKLKRWFAANFAGRHAGEHPSPSECNKRATKIVGKLRQR